MIGCQQLWWAPEHYLSYLLTFLTDQRLLLLTCELYLVITIFWGIGLFLPMRISLHFRSLAGFHGTCHFLVCVYVCVCVCVCVCVRVCVLSHIWLLATPWTVTHQTPMSMGFSRKEYWSGLPCPALGDLPDPATEPMSPACPALQADSLPLSQWGKAWYHLYALE